MDFAALMTLVFGLVGGLGLFLLGMKNMSEGMQAVAGNSLRRMISAVTNNRFMAIGVGTVVTGLVQSSSITTVMVVGFVNSGLMELVQGIGVIMGANIGTTITGWFLALKIGKYGLPLLGLGAFTYLFSKGDRLRFWAMIFMGVGMVFVGLTFMKEACGAIKELDDFEAWFHRFDASTYLGVLQCAMAGCVLTMLVQSSSATLGITMSLALQGIISYETAAALVLGENIGTTVTAILASLGATTVARRAAYFHAIFNLAGVLWITAIFGWYVQLVPWLIGVETIQVGGITTVAPENTSPAIAAVHTIFNVINTLLFIPLMPLCVQLLNRAVPSKEFKEKPRLTDLDIRILETPLMAIEQSRVEIGKMGEGCAKMLGWLDELLQEDEPDKKLGDRLKHREQVLDVMQDEISEYVTNLLAGNVPHSVADEARLQIRMADEYESVSDYIANLDNFDRKLRRDGHRFTEEQRKDLGKLNGHVTVYVTAVNEALAQDNRNVLIKTEAVSKRIKNEVKQLRRKHLDDLSSGLIAPLVSVAFLASLNAYSRVRDHTHNIAEAVSGEK